MNYQKLCCRLLALLLCLMLLPGSLPAAFADSMAYTNKKTTIYMEKNGKLKKAGTAPKGVEMVVTDTNGDWAQVEKDGKVAYVKLSALSKKSAQPEKDAVACNKFIYAAVDDVIVYASDDEESKELTTLPKGTKQQMVAYSDDWCMVKNGKYYGFVLREEMSLEPVIQPTATPAPQKGEKVTTCRKTVYVAVDNAKVYNSDSTASGQKDTLSLGQKLIMTAYTDTWCLVKAGSNRGYMLRSDLSLKKVNAPTATPDDNAEKVTTCNKKVYVALDGAKVYGAASTSARVQDTLSLGQKLTMTAYTDTWCLVKAGSKSGFMLREDLSLEPVATATPAPTATPTPTPTATPTAAPTATPTAAPTATPNNVTVCDKPGYAIEDGVKVYAKADTGSSVVDTLKKNDQVRVTGYTDKWCQLKNGSSVGYVLREKLSQTELPTLPTDLKYGDTGEPVKTLQKRLKELDYFNGSIGGNYLAQTRDAVRLFQSQHKLTADGVAGPATLKLLFSDEAKKYDPKLNAPSTDTSTGGSTASGPANSQVQEMDWWTSDIQKIFSRGTTATITDCNTGISWKERRMGGSNHADVQPVTTADTAAMKSAVGNWSWNRRAIWVTINGKNYAASMNCMPHGSDSISGNGFDGHHCIHFTNSRTHGTNQMCSLHQAAIKKALKHKP